MRTSIGTIAMERHAAPFELIKPAVSPAPTYPILWGHDAPRERKLVVAPDSEGQVKAAMGRITQSALQGKVTRVWETASHTHYNRDLRFNSQSLVVVTTERLCIGGRSWPSVTFQKPEHGYAFSLWCNSTLGLILHWWGYKQNSERTRHDDRHWYSQHPYFRCTNSN